MKDNEVHEGLDRAEIRDYFAQALYDVFWKKKFRNFELERRKEALLQFKDFDYAIESEKLQIEMSVAKLEEAQKNKVLLILIREQGWGEWDVSDWIEKTQVDSYLSFIGSKEEKEAFEAVHEPKDA